MCSKLAAEYPLQSAWWLSHFYHYDPDSANTQSPNPQRINEHIKRVKFFEDVIKNIHNLTGKRILNVTDIEGNIIGIVESGNLVEMIRNTQDFMGRLIRFATAPASSSGRIKMDRRIMDFDFEKKQVLMPINTNLQPKLPENPLDKSFSVYENKPIYIHTEAFV